MQGRRFQFSPLLSYAHPTLPTRTGCRLARSALCVACSKLAVYQLDSKPAAQAPLPRGPQPRSRGLAGRCGATSAVLLQDQPGAAKGSHTAPRGYTSALVRGFEGAPGGRLGTLGAAPLAAPLARPPHVAGPLPYPTTLPSKDVSVPAARPLHSGSATKCHGGQSRSPDGVWRHAGNTTKESRRPRQRPPSVPPAALLTRTRRR